MESSAARTIGGVDTVNIIEENVEAGAMEGRSGTTLPPTDTLELQRRENRAQLNALQLESKLSLLKSWVSMGLDAMKDLSNWVDKGAKHEAKAVVSTFLANLRKTKLEIDKVHNLIVQTEITMFQLRRELGRLRNVLNQKLTLGRLSPADDA